MRSWCFDSVATEVDGVTTYDREYGSAEFREVMGKLVGNGVYANPANNMQVTAGGGMTVSVLPGYCWIKGALGVVDEAETLTLDASSAGRTDVIVARFDLSLAVRDIHLAVVKGAEGSYSAPTLTRNDSVYDIQLARVRVNAGATVIALTDITDTRHDDNLCGIVTGIIDQIDATDLFAQYESIFNAFMAQLENVLSGDVAGNLLLLIDNHKANTNNPHNVTREQLGIGSTIFMSADDNYSDFVQGNVIDFTDQSNLPETLLVVYRKGDESCITFILLKDAPAQTAKINENNTLSLQYTSGSSGRYGLKAQASQGTVPTSGRFEVSAIGI